MGVTRFDRRVLGAIGALATALSLTGMGNWSPREGQHASRVAATLPRGIPVLTVGPAVHGRAIPAGFLGVSLEYWALEAYAGQDPRAVDPVLVQLLRNLAPHQQAVLRVGGISTDRTWWPVASYHRPRGVDYALTASRVAVIEALAQAARARLILGINLEANKPRLAAAEADELLAKIGRTRIQALELGNEPERYNWAWYFARGGRKVPGRPASYDFASYLDDLRRMHQALPGLPLAGPASGSTQWLASLPQLIASEPRLRLVTVHRYPALACFVPPGSPWYPRISLLLSSASSAGLADSVVPSLEIAHAHHLALRIGEMNTIACGTAPGINDTFAMALWALGALFSDLQVGVDGVNIHTYPGAPYQLFKLTRSRSHWSGVVEPEYYGLLMFAQAAPAGARLLQVSGASGAVRAWATQGRDRKVRVELVNDDTARAHAVAVAVPGEHGHATLERLLAPSVRATGGVTLGGQSFGSQTATGLLSGRLRTVPVDPVAGEFVVRMPAGSAAMLTVR